MGLLGPLAVTSDDLGEHWGPVIDVRRQLLQAGWCAADRAACGRAGWGLPAC